MSKIFRITLLPVLLVLVYGSFSVARAATDVSTLERILERGELIVGTSGNLPSMSVVDPAGRVTGFDIDMAGMMAQLMGVNLAIKVIPFDTLLTSLQAGKVDVVMSNMTITAQRNLKVAFVGPYMKSGKCFITKNELLARAKPSVDINNADTKLVVLEGSTSEDIVRSLYPKATIVKIDYFGDAAEMIKANKAAAVMTDYPICKAILKEYPDAGFVELVTLLTYEPIGIALPAGDAQFINWTENFLQRLDGTGALTRLSKTWFGEAALSK